MNWVRTARRLVVHVKLWGLLAAAAAAAAEDSVQVPVPSGLYHVGTRTIYLTDASRRDPYAANPTTRELAVRFWYPHCCSFKLPDGAIRLPGGVVLSRAANQCLSSASAPKTVTVTNQGSTTLRINNIFIGGLAPGDFAETHTCGISLAPSASCTISVAFTPTAKGARKGGLGISSRDPASPDAIALNGTGTVVSLSTAKLSFGMHAVGTTSLPQTVTVTNVGSTQLSFTGINITGTNRSDFSETNTCATSIGPQTSCTISVTFEPSAIGRRGAAVVISDDGGGSPQRVALAGTGT